MDRDAVVGFLVRQFWSSAVDAPAGAQPTHVDLAKVDGTALVRAIETNTKYDIAAAVNLPPPSTSASASASAGKELPKPPRKSSASASTGPPAAIVAVPVMHSSDTVLTPQGSLLTDSLGDALDNPAALAQLAFSILLCATKGDLADTDNDSLRTMRSRLELSAKRQKILLRALGFNEGDEGARECTVQHLARLIAHHTPATFDGVFEDFVGWVSAHSALVAGSLVATFKGAGVTDADTCIIGGTKTTFAELRSKVDREVGEPVRILSKFPNTEAFTAKGEPEYRAAAKRLVQFVGQVLGSVSTGTAGGVIMGEVAQHAPIPYPYNCELYEVLLSTLYDHENQYARIHSYKEAHHLLRFFRREMRISEKMDQLCAVRVQYSLFMEFRNASVLDSAMEQLLASEDIVSPDRNVRKFSDAHSAAIDTGLRTDLLKFMSEFCSEKLSDYRSNFGLALESITPFVDCYVCVTELLDPEMPAVRILRTVIRNSVSKHFNALFQERGLKSPAPFAELTPFVDTIVAEINAECKLFGPHFPVSEEVPSINPLIVGAYLVCISEEVNASVKAGFFETLDATTAGLVTTLTRLEEKVAASDRQVLYGIYRVFRDALMRWVEEQGGKFITFLQRSLMAETWMEISDPPCHSSSAVDIFAILHAAATFLLSFNIPKLLPVLQALAAKMNNAIGEYCNAIVNSLGRSEAFIPPIPSFSMSKTKFGGLVKKNIENNHILPGDEHRLNNQTRRKLYVQLNCLIETSKKLKELETLIKDTFDGLVKTRPDVALLDSAGDNANSSNNGGNLLNSGTSALFNSTYSIIEMAISRTISYIGQKIIFFDLRNVFLNQLYVPSVKAYRIDRVTKEVDPILCEIMEDVYYSHARHLIYSFFQQFLLCYKRVLLDGGFDRIFAIEDAHFFDEDTKHIESLFIAEDETTHEVNGLDPNQVTQLTGQLFALILDFEEPTKDLIDKCNMLPQETESCYAFLNETPPNMLFPEIPAPFDFRSYFSASVNSRSVCFRILVHRRNDEKARKWVHDKKAKIKA